MVKKERKKRIYEIWFGNDIYTPEEAFNRFEAVEQALKLLTPNEVASISYIKMKGSSKKFKYPWQAKNVKPVGGVEAEKESVAEWRSMMMTTGGPVDSSCSGSIYRDLPTDIQDQLAGNEQAPMTGGDMGAEPEPVLKKGHADKPKPESDLNILMEFMRTTINEEVKDVMEVNEMLVKRLEKYAKDDVAGVTINIRPGGKTIIIYGGKVMELNDVAPAPAGEVGKDE